MSRKALKFLLVATGIVSLLIVGACTHEEPDNQQDNQEKEHDEAYYAAQASISSSEANYTVNDEGGTVHFKTEGGSTVINVDCGTSWTVDNHASNLFTATADISAGTLTVTAGQNTVEEEVQGTLMLMTANQKISFATVSVIQDAYGAPEINVGTNEWHAPAKGSLSTEITVECSLDDFDVEIDGGWLSYEKTDAGITLTAAENESPELRSTTVLVSATDGIQTGRDYIAVTQDGKAYISLSKENISVSGAAAKVQVEVESNVNWDYSFTDDWLSIDRFDETLTITVSRNETEESREANVCLAGGDGAENTAETQLTIIQGEATIPLILEYTLKSAGTKVTLPLSGTVNCSVDWGDGSDIEFVTSVEPTHTYSSAGKYSVTVDGTVTALNSYNITDLDLLTAVVQWGNTGLTDMTCAFGLYTELTSIATDNTGAFSEVTSFDRSFYGCTALTEIPEGFFDYCSKVKSLYATFYDCDLISSLPNGIFDNCTSVTDFSYLFHGCTSLKEISSSLFSNCTAATTFLTCFYNTGLVSVPSGLFKGLNKVERFKNVFANCSSLMTVGSEVFAGCSSAYDMTTCFNKCTMLSEIPSDLFYGCTAATTFNGAFRGCTNIKTVPAELFKGFDKVEDFSLVFAECSILTTLGSKVFADCSSATSFDSAFYSCGRLSTIPEDTFSGCTAVKDFYGIFLACGLSDIPSGLFNDCTKALYFDEAFGYCTALEEVPANLFVNCTEVTDFYALFYGCTSLKKLPTGLFDKCAKVTSFQFSFSLCSSLTEVPDGIFYNCPDVTTFSGTFSECYSLVNVPVDIFDNCKKVTNFLYTFLYCYNWTGESPYTVMDGGTKVHLYERKADIGFTEPTITEDCFYGCEKLTDYNDIPSSWGGGVSMWNTVSSMGNPSYSKGKELVSKTAANDYFLTEIETAY